MLIFKIALLFLALYNLILALIIRNNIFGFKETLLNYIYSPNFEDWFNNKFGNSYTIYTFIVLILVILALC